MTARGASRGTSRPVRPAELIPTLARDPSALAIFLAALRDGERALPAGAGLAAYRGGRASSAQACPYAPGSALAMLWHAGRLAARHGAQGRAC